MKPKVYLETTVPSYLTARPSRDLIRAAHQQLTREWWEVRRPSFDIYISPAVIEEVSAGDPAAAADRLNALGGLQILEITDQSRELARELLKSARLPAKASLDALHIALSAVHGMDYLLTWNCKHIANVALRGGIEEVIRSRGYDPALICTPEELLEV